MMKKNCFNFKKAMTSVMMLSMVSFTMTSCDDFWDDLFGTPTNPPTETPSEPEDDGSVTLTATGATLKVEKLSDITELLNQIKSDIASKVGQEYVVEIVGEGLKATSDDNTISVPKVEKSNINLSFANAITTEVPLLVKAAEGNTKSRAVNQLTITMPTSEGLNLEIYMPETAVTLKAASGTLVYDKVVSTHASGNPYATGEGIKSSTSGYSWLNTGLLIEDGITIKTLQANLLDYNYNGDIMVRGDSKIETYVYVPTANNEGSVSIYYDKEDQINWLWIANALDKGFVSYIFNEKDGIVKHYAINNLKIAKGEADYASVNIKNYDLPLEKLIIEEGAVVKINDPYAKVIEGEGKGAQLIKPQDWVFDPQIRDGKSYCEAGCPMTITTEMKGISLSLELGANAKEILATADSTAILLTDVPSNLEDCTLKFDMVYFDRAETATDLVKNCKFEPASNKTNIVRVEAPAQSAAISSYKFTFADCDFSEGFKLDTDIRRWEYVYDESGEKIEWTWWEYQDNDGYWQHVVESEIPEGVEANGPFTGYKTTPVEFNNYYVTFAFSNCKIGSNILTHTSNFINNAWCPDGIYIRFEIDGNTFKAIWDEADKRYYLVEV